MTHSAAASIACCSSLSSLGLRYCAHSLFAADRCLWTLIKVSDLAVFHVLSRTTIICSDCATGLD